VSEQDCRPAAVGLDVERYERGLTFCHRCFAA
jgi:hypothetical protein